MGGKKRTNFFLNQKTDEFPLRFVTDRDMVQTLLHPCTQARALRRGCVLCWPLAVTKHTPRNVMLLQMRIATQNS